MNEQIVNKQIFFVGDDALIVPKPTVIWILQRDDEGIVPYEFAICLYFVHRLFIHAFAVIPYIILSNQFLTGLKRLAARLFLAP